MNHFKNLFAFHCIIFVLLSGSEKAEGAAVGVEKALATCKIQDRFLTPFEGTRHRFDNTLSLGCYILLTSDCDIFDKLYVTAKGLGTNDIKLEILFSGATITVKKSRPLISISFGGPPPTNLEVGVNGQLVPLPYDVNSNGEIAQIIETSDGGIKIITEEHDVSFDGATIFIQRHKPITSKICGICSNSAEHNGQVCTDVMITEKS